MSSRARPTRSGSVGVSDHLLVDHVGEVAFERPEGLHRRLALGQTTPVVGAARGVVAELDDGHDVEDAVDASVAGPRQPVAALVTQGPGKVVRCPG
jgi:hypothetical protein